MRSSVGWKKPVADFWSDEGKSHSAFPDMSLRGNDSNTYSEFEVVNVSDIWKERYFSDPWRLLCENCRSNSECTEVCSSHSSSRSFVKEQTVITSDKSMIRKGGENCRLPDNSNFNPNTKNGVWQCRTYYSAAA